MRQTANERVIKITDGKPAIFLVRWDGHYIDRPENWVEVPEEAMPAIEFIIEEVKK